VGVDPQAVADETAALTEVQPEVRDAPALAEVTDMVSAGEDQMDDTGVAVAMGTWRLLAGRSHGLPTDEDSEPDKAPVLSEEVLSEEFPVPAEPESPEYMSEEVEPEVSEEVWSVDPEIESLESVAEDVDPEVSAIEESADSELSSPETMLDDVESEADDVPDASALVEPDDEEP